MNQFEFRFPKNPMNETTIIDVKWKDKINYSLISNKNYDLTTNEGIKEAKEIFHQIIDMLIDEIVKGEKK